MNDPEEDPAYESDLGRAIVRGRERRTAHREDTRSRARWPEKEASARREFNLRPFAPLRGAGFVLALGAGMSLVMAALFSNGTTEPKHSFWTVAMFSSILFLPIGFLCLIAAFHKLWRYPATVSVGADGVLVGKRFVPYSKITTVDHALRPKTISRPVYGDTYEDETWYEWTLSLWTDDGEIKLMHRLYPTEEVEPQGGELAYSLDMGLEAWQSNQRGEPPELEVARGSRTGSQWFEALRGIGAGGNAAYRSATVRPTRLTQLLDDPWGKPSIRAAAAVALAASGDTEAADKLRIAAELMANPRLRVALESIAEGMADGAIAEVLAELDELEREEPKDA